MSTAALSYDTVGYVLDSARVRLNDRVDTLQLISGVILDNTDPYMLQLVNNAWRRLMWRLADKGYSRLINETIVAGFPAVASPDPAVQCWLNGSGCSDGVTEYVTPSLPADFTHPLKMWERWSGINAQFCDPPMEKMLDGLWTRPPTTTHRKWEWRGDTIYMPGSLSVEDLRIRYANYLPDFADSVTLRWYQQPVPIMMASDALAWMICAELENARKGGDGTAAKAYCEKAEAATDRIFNRDVRADQRVNIRRRPRSGRVSGW